MKCKISKDRNKYGLFSLKRLNENQVLFWLILFFIAAAMFIFNRYTTFMADDYSYMNSFAGTGRIESILDIFPSMYAHAFSMNGRLVPHFFVQLFLLSSHSGRRCCGWTGPAIIYGASRLRSGICIHISD